MLEAMRINEKLAREAAIEALKDEVIKHFEDENIGIDDLELQTIITKVKLLLSDDTFDNNTNLCLVLVIVVYNEDITSN